MLIADSNQVFDLPVQSTIRMHHYFVKINTTVSNAWHSLNGNLFQNIVQAQLYLRISGRL